MSARKIVAAALAVAVVSVSALALWPVYKNTTGDTLTFTLSSDPKICATAKEGVTGIQSPEAIPGKLHTKLTRAQRAIHALFQARSEHVIHLKYALPAQSNPATKIADLTLTLPPEIHTGTSYELSCRTGNAGDFTVYRKFSPYLRVTEHGYEEPPVMPLPRKCIGDSGEIDIRLSTDWTHTDLVGLLNTSVFRAELWNADAHYADTLPLDIYTPKMSYSPGETIAFHAHAADGSQPGIIDIVHIGKGNKPWKTIEGVKLAPQKMTAFSFREGVDWPVTASLALPGDTPAGYYVAVLRQGKNTANFPFVVKPTVRDQNAIAVIAAVNTWQAYNNWGDGSFYENTMGEKCLNTDYGRLISTRRPIAGPDMLAPIDHYDHGFRSERAVAEWLDTNNVPYVVFTDRDLNDHPGILDGYKTVLLPPHPEYYTNAMFTALDKHVAQGGSILDFGGNVLNYKVAMRGDQVEKHENGRLNDLGDGFDGIWLPHFGRAPAKLFGVEYDARSYDTFAPYRVMQADNAVFAGTGLKNGDTFAEDGSGHEMDVVTKNSPSNVTVLAKGTNARGYGADMVIFDTPQGGRVFSVGSISFFYALAHDQKLGTLINNVIKLMQTPAAQSETHK